MLAKPFIQHHCKELRYKILGHTLQHVNNIMIKRDLKIVSAVYMCVYIIYIIQIGPIIYIMYIRLK
jgi:hypothetical protein